MTRRVSLARVTDCAARVASCVAADPRLVAELMLWRAVWPLLIRVMSVERLTALMTPRRADARSSVKIATILRIVSTGGRLLVSRNCLQRSLVTYRLLARAGADVSAVLGIRREGLALAGHAWIQLDGRALDQPGNDSYTPMLAVRREHRSDRYAVASDAKKAS